MCAVCECFKDSHIADTKTNHETETLRSFKYHSHGETDEAFNTIDISMCSLKRISIIELEIAETVFAHVSANEVSF